MPDPAPNPDRVAVLETHIGEKLYIRSDPSTDAVRSFVSEQNRRYHAGEAGGPDGLPAYLIRAAHFYAHESDPEPESEIDISDLL
jgi:hypothetical protein